MRITVVPSSYHFSDYNWRELRHLWSFWHTVRRVCAVAGGRGGSKVTGVICLSSPFFTPFIATSAMVAGWDSAQHLQYKLPGAKPAPLLRPHLERSLQWSPLSVTQIEAFSMCVGYLWPWCRRELGSLCFIPGASASSSVQALPAVVLTSREACQKTYVIKWIHSRWHFLLLLYNCMEWDFSIDLHAVFCSNLSFLGKSQKINQSDLCT